MIKDIKDNFSTIEVYDIYLNCMYKPTFEKFKSKAENFKRDNTVSVYGYYKDNELVGMIVSQKSDNITKILGIAVREQERRSGIGSKLINYIKENSKTTIFAETDEDAVGFYRKNGFYIKQFSENYNGEIIVRYRCEL